MTRNRLTLLAASFLAIFVATVSAPALGQTFTNLFNFHSTVGEQPYGALVQGRNGELYGTANVRGAGLYGTIFKITPAGKLGVIHSFDRSDYYSGDQLVLGPDGNLYGTTPEGGSGWGQIFKITPTGTYTILHNFAYTEGYEPSGALALGLDGNFYGTTVMGGAHGGQHGSVFKITPAGAFTVLYTFDPGDVNGAYPNGLVSGNDGNFYGAAQGGGAYDSGTIFKITAAGTLTTLYSFDTLWGGAQVVLGNDGNLYGTTQQGIIYEVTPTGIFTQIGTIQSGTMPVAPLVVGSDGNFYGTTFGGGSTNCGTSFMVTPTGTFTSLHSFTRPTDGCYLNSALVQHTNGDFYGTATVGGAEDGGTAFVLNTGLSPFAAFVFRFGRVGTTIQLLGQGFTGTAGVSFNGTAASSFKALSDTFMTAVVPAGATTGPVTVATPRGTLTSNVSFVVVGQ